MSRDMVEEETILRLGDQSEVTVSADAVKEHGRELLSHAPVNLAGGDEPERVRVLIDGYPVEVIPLVAAALGLATDDLRLSPTVSALRRLGFEFEDSVPIEDRESQEQGQRRRRSGDDDASEDTQTQPSSDDPDDELTDLPVDDVEASYMTPDLANSLQRLAGQWVAIRGNTLVGHADTLRELRESVGPGKVSVLFVPQPSLPTGE